ncbi:hypothetical protein CIG75_17515 [Tumebacillus algifaecis]|uniref:Uncharacterized protein n=1 Tax=Tumebacillus algifaecis TaxID=1214604 RepID=A0A223D551_9BACL|nr:hypothetical protein CIG75_17515 [Tumebacillus algifaecis]
MLAFADIKRQGKDGHKELISPVIVSIHLRTLKAPNGMLGAATVPDLSKRSQNEGSGYFFTKMASPKTTAFVEESISFLLVAISDTL